MNIGKFSVTRPVAVSMRIAALVLLGWICLMRLPIDLLPRVDIPTVGVTVSWPNTQPQQMEVQITRPVENAVSMVDGLYLISSTSSLGSCFVRVQFNYGVNIDTAAINVMQAVGRAQRAFPSDPTISQPGVFKFDPNSLPILAYGVTSSDPSRTLIKLQDLLTNEVTPVLESAGGVASASASGSQPRAIMVDVSPDKLQSFGISIDQVSRRISQENIQLPAGIATQGNTEYTIVANGYITNLDDLRSLPLTTFNGNQVTLGQVAAVRDASQDVRGYARLNGEPALSLTITKQADANTVDTNDAVRAKIETVKKTYPDLQFSVLYDQAQFVRNSVDDLKQTAIIGAILAIIIITFFLRNLRSTFVVALSIPISVISTFTLIYFMGYTLNTISLSGLALATGLIVDDAIVVLENIYRHIERDSESVADAAVAGTQEILGAVFASTFTVMIVFLPMLLIKGQAGQTYSQFAMVVVFSLGISLLDAMTVVPMLTSRLVRTDEVMEEAHPELRAEHGKKSTPLTRIFDYSSKKLTGLDHSYRRGLVWSLAHRWAIVLVALGAVGSAALLWPMVGRENIPQTDSGNINVTIRLPVGTALAVTNQTMQQVEAMILADPDVDSVLAGAGMNVGLRGSGVSSGNQGSATVRLKTNRKSSTNDVSKRLSAKFRRLPGILALVQPFDIVAAILGGNTQGISVDVYGQNLNDLSAQSKDVMNAMQQVPGLESVDTSVQDSNPEMDWVVDRQKAQALGVTFQQIAQTINAATSGQLGTYFLENGYQYPIYVDVPRSQRTDVNQIMNLPVAGTGQTPATSQPASAAAGAPSATSSGAGGNAAGPTPVRLGQIAHAVTTLGPNQIQRQNMQRVISVSGRVTDRPESAVVADLQTALGKLQFRKGTSWQWGIQQKQAQMAFSGLGLSVFLAIALIYMLLATQFESFIFPLVVLCSVPLCGIGLVLALFLTGRAFGLTAFIGLLMLIGIVVKNGILLVEYTNQLRARGMPREEAILTAGPTRLRPILMTTLTAILGMMPMALGLGSGSELYVPMATSVIGGLATSTMLTLFVVPTVYTFFDDLGRRFHKHDRDLGRPTALVEPSPAATAAARGDVLGGEPHRG